MSIIFTLGFFVGMGAGILLSMFSVWVGMRTKGWAPLEAWEPRNLMGRSRGEILGPPTEVKIEESVGRFWEESGVRDVDGALLAIEGDDEESV